MLDAAERTACASDRWRRDARTLNAVLGVGSLVSNPIDGGFGVLTSAENYMASIEAMQADPNVDLLLLQEALPREAGSDRAESYIPMVEAYVAGGAPKPIAFVHPDLARPDRLQPRAARARAARLVPAGGQQGAARDRQRGAARRAERLRMAARPADARAAESRRARALRAPAQARRARRGRIQGVLRAYGIATPAEALVKSRDDAVTRGGPHRLPGGAQGGLGHAHAQVGRRRGGAQPRDGARWRPNTSACRAACQQPSPACWSAGRSAAASSSCSGCIATPRWAWW